MALSPQKDMVFLFCLQLFAMRRSGCIIQIMQGRTNFIVTKNKQRLVLSRPNNAATLPLGKDQNQIKLEITKLVHGSEKSSPCNRMLQPMPPDNSQAQLRKRSSVMVERRPRKMRTELADIQNKSLRASVEHLDLGRTSIDMQQQVEKLCCSFLQKRIIYGTPELFYMPAQTFKNLLKFIHQSFSQSQIAKLLVKLAENAHDIPEVIPKRRTIASSKHFKKQPRQVNLFIAKVFSQTYCGHRKTKECGVQSQNSVQILPKSEAKQLMAEIQQLQAFKKAIENQTEVTSQTDKNEGSDLATIRETQDQQDNNFHQQEHFLNDHFKLFDEFIENQPNKIVQQAFKRHKYLEEEMFAYADFLKISKIGIVTYTPQTNIEALDTRVDRDQKQINKFLIQSDSPLIQKCRTMRNFVSQVRVQYDTLIKELMQVIDKKTEQSKTFVSKIIKWQENYLARKQFLSNLKKDYCEELYKMRHSFFDVSAKIASLPTKRDQIQAHEHLQTANKALQKIDEIIMLGNSFY